MIKENLHNRILVKEYSDIKDLQKSHRIIYTVKALPDATRILTSRIERDGRIELYFYDCDIDFSYGLRLVKYLYENGVSPSCCGDILSNFSIPYKKYTYKKIPK